MYRYSVFGGVLASELEVPGLRPAATDDDVDWTLRIRPAEAPDEAGWGLIAEADIGDGAHVRLLEGSGGFRLAYSDTGVFEVRSAGTQIVWYAPPKANVEFARLDLLGRVMTVALQMAGSLCLHASAVTVDGGALGFLGSKGFGKSTLATALTYAGARLVTDDTLALHPGSPVICEPGVHSVRLRQMAAGRFDRTRDRLDPERPWNRVIDTPPEPLLMTSGTPLRALYVLSPAPAETEPLVRREPLEVLPAALALVGHGKLGELQGRAQSITLLEQAIRVAETVPSYSLIIARDLDRIDEVAREIVRWHTSPGVPDELLAG